MLAPELIRIQEKPLANWVTPAKINAIRGEFMRQCDGLDGLADGVINNYMACRAIFDVTQGAAEPAPWAAKRCPDNVDPESGGHQRGRLPHRRPDLDAASSSTRRYKFATPLANGVTTFGMWVPNTDPSGSGLIADARFKGQEGAAADAPMHSHLGVLGVTGFLMQDLTPTRSTTSKAARSTSGGEELSRVLDSTNPDLTRVRAPRRQDDRHHRHQRHAGVAGAQLDYYQSVLDKMGRPRSTTSRGCS